MRNVVLLWAAMALALPLWAQEPAGVIEGRLGDSITRAPVGAARISIRGPAARAATTASGGDFRFDQLPPGDYEVTIAKSGYLDSSKGSVHPAIHLKPGALTESVVIDLTPLGALEGAVLDDEGKPLAGVSVTGARGDFITDRASCITEKEGRFAFEDLVPGSYQVVVSLPHEVRTRNLARDSSGDYYGYAAAQYYPGADDPRLAIPVAIPAGVRLRNIDLRLRRTLLVEFSGRLLEMSGREPVTGADVQLIGAVSGTPDRLWGRNSAGADGSFRFSLIQPGAYTLAIYRADRSPFPYLVPIQIGKAGADDLPVAIPPFSPVQGSLKMPESKMHEPNLRDSKLPWFGSVNVRLHHRTGASATRQTKPDGSFDFESVPPGEYSVEVETRNLILRSNPSHRLSVSAIRFGGQNAFRQPIRVAESGNPALEIQLSDEPAGIVGRVVDSGGRAGTSFLVTVAPVVARPGLRGLMVASPDFQFPDLPPGDYEVTAVTYSRLGPTVGAFTAKACDETVRVTVRDGAVSSITLRPCP